MNSLHAATQVILSSLLLARETRIPTSHGLLDKGLKTAIEKGAFPPWVHESLHFADSRIGLQCVELPAMLKWAQSAELTEEPNPSYQYAQFQVSERVARYLLQRLKVDEPDAKRWGELLVECIAAEEQAADSFQAARA